VSQMRGSVAAQTVGAVTEMHVQVGDRVAKGDILAVLDIEKLTSERAAHAATADAVAARAVAAEARLERVEQEIARYEKLRRSAAFSRAHLQDKEQERASLRSELDAARAQLVQAKANLALAEMNLARGTVRAPYDGVVTALHTEIGSYRKEGEAVVALVNDRKLEIEADVPAARIAGLKPGAEVAVLLPDGTKHSARVRAVVPDENAMTRTRLVRFTPEFGQTTTPLADNAAATVVLPIGAATPALTVHKDAILRQGRQALVFVANDGKADQRRVQLGRASGTRFEVLDGLGEGDLAIVRGNERLRPGQPVLVPEVSPGMPSNNSPQKAGTG
ncbi:MAG: efflux RND transporter periplasmic adaptor subunit, partial [Alphaproteobacteria bacterium]|nr:efflux RND transporter periplasmic adaptor subunit [Alphaproteobacteria bacterium]